MTRPLTPYRLFQCPGCWGYLSAKSRPDTTIECDCGERMTRVDLRDSEAEAAAIARDRAELVERVARWGHEMAVDGCGFDECESRDDWRAEARRLLGGGE